MNKLGLIGLILVISLMAVFSTGSRMQPGNVSSPAINDTVNKAPVTMDKDYGKMPLSFIPNKGQMDKQVYFYLQGKDKSVYFTSSGLTYALAGPEENHPDPESKPKPSTPSTRWVVKLDFVNARKDAKPECLEKSGTVISYFKGKPAEWQTGLQAAAKIIYRNLWPGIDLVYYGTVNRMKYEFIVHPGADPAQIKLAYRGAESVMENSRGQLEVQTPAGGFFDDTPMAWQEITGKRETVSLKYAIENKNPSNPKDACIYGFSVGEYDRNQTLILDPAVIVYCGYIGPSLFNYGNQIVVDTSGCAYITGDTNASATYFPVTTGPDLTYNGGSFDVFVAKVKADGTGLLYCGYIGGSGNDTGEAIAVDGSGCAYVTGYTDSSEASFPVTVGPDLTYNGGFNDAFIAKINAAGTGLHYCGYIGGSAGDGGKGIDTDSSGYAYVIGFTSSTETTFPAAGGPDLTQNGNYDAFVTKVRDDGTGLVYCGYIGGNNYESGKGIAVDASGCAYVTGEVGSNESTFPVLGGPDLTFNEGNYDAFVAKVNAAGTGLVYCGYIGGAAQDGGRHISVDALDCAYVLGETASDETSFPVAVGPDLTYNGGDHDAFVAKVNTAGTGLVYCGYIGGSGDETSGGIAVDTTGCSYVTGGTGSTETTFPVTGGLDLTFNGGNSDAFVAKLHTDGASLEYCGYIGGANDDEGHGIAIDAAGFVYITGNTYSTETTFPVTVGPDLTYNGISINTFVAKLSGYPIHTVDFTAGSGGSLTGVTNQTVIQGNSCTAVEAASNTGYQFVNWTGTGGFVTTTDNPLTVTNVTTDMTITANFVFISLTGQVTDSGASGIANVQVVLYDTNFNQVSETWTDGSGNYTFYDLNAGDYKLFFGAGSAGNYVDEWYNDKNSFDNADVVSISAGNTTTVNAALTTGGTITGRVTDSSNNGIEGVNVQVCDLAQYWLYGTSTDSNGDYTITRVKTGSFKVEFRPDGLPGNYARQWYNNQVSFNNANVVNVTAGNTTSNIDARLANGGSISGRVTDSGNNGIENVNINVHDSNGNQIAWSSTDSNGEYTVSGIPTGNHKVQFWPGNAGNFMPEWYNDQGSFQQADSLLVVAGQTVIGIDAQLADSGAVSGRVTNADSTVGIANVEVQICDLDGYWYPGTGTDSDGNYTLRGLPAGNYKVEFRTHWVPGNYVGEWYNDQNSFNNATPVTVIVGQTTMDIDAALADGGAVSGRVTDATGSVGLANVDVNICDLDGNGFYGVCTNGNGEYTIHGLPAGDYKIQFTTHNVDGSYAGEWYNDKNSFQEANAVSVFVGQTTTQVDAQLADGGYISGWVTDSVNKGVANVNVNVYDASGNLLEWSTTNSSGYYTIKGVPAGDHQVQFWTGNAGNYLEEWYNDKNSQSEADPVTVTAGNTAGDINAQLTTGGIITGKVMDSSLIGIENITVCVYDTNYNWQTNVRTDSAGDFTINRLPTGNYKIYFETGGAGNYIREWYNDKTEFDSANTVSVTAGNTTRNVNAVLAAGGAVSGRVTDSGNNGIANVDVCICDLNHYWYPGNSTDNDGYYTLNGIPAGDYKIEFRTNWTPGNWVGEWYNDQNSFENATPVTVIVDHTVTDIDAQLADGGAISGRVTDSTGTVGIPNVNINICDLNQNWLNGVSTNNNGDYTLHGVPAGTYKIQFSAQHLGNYANEWWNNQRRFESANEVIVTTGNTVTDIDAQLEIVGSISGTLTDASTSLPIENVRAYVYDLANNEMGNCWTDSDGHYTVNNLAPANYKVYFNTYDTPVYIEEWYNDRDSFENADEVTVNENAATTVDAALAAVQDDAYEPNDDFDHAAEITVGVYDNLVYLDALQDGTERDWYKIYVGPDQAGKNLKVNLRVTSPYPTNPPDGWASDLDFDILDGTGQTLAKAFSSSDNETLYIANLVEGWYYIDLTYCSVGYGPGGTGAYADYAMTVEVDTAANLGIGYISGRVTDEQDQGIGGSPVLMGHNPYDWAISFPIVFTDANGYYTIAYTPGDYTLQFNFNRPNFNPAPPNYVSEYYNDKALLEEAQVFSLHVGTPITGVDAVLMPGATISGALTHSNGNPVVNTNQARITAFDKNSGNQVSVAFNDTSGNYSIKYLPTGTYKIQFRARDENWAWYAREWYDNQPSLGTGTDVVVSTVGQVITGIDNQFSARSVIQGRVTNGNNEGVGNVQIEVYSVLDPGNVIFTGWTNGNGDFSVGQLPAGDMKIYFNADVGGTPYVSEWYNDKNSFENADAVTLTVGQTAANIEAQLSDKGIISGQVTDASGTLGLPNVNVEIYDMNNNGISGVNTDDNGDYAISGLPAGDYKLYFNPGGTPDNYLGEWYNDKNSFENADAVTVNNGQTTGGIDAQLADGGGISGRVTNSSGTVGIANVNVQVCDPDNTWYPGTNTDSNGNYTIYGLPAGDYKIQFRTDWTAGNYVSEWYDDKISFDAADPVTVIVGQTAGSFDAQLADAGSISGRVTNPADSGIQDVNVAAYDLNYRWIASVNTDSSGNYTLSHLPPGSVKVYFETNQAGNYAPEWYNDKGSFETADALTITAGQTQLNIDAQLIDGGIISGRVSNEADEGIQGVRVRILYPDGNWAVPQVTTDDNGNYTVQRLAPGYYKIDFYTVLATGSYVREWYDDKTSLAAADLVEVTSGNTFTANAILAAGSMVTGRVTNEQGSGIQDVRVQLRDLANINRYAVNTNANGDYTIKGITAGLYKVFFNSYSAAGSYIPEFYNDQAYFKDSETIDLTAVQTITAVDAVLAPGCTISGTVTDESTNPLELIDVYVFGTDGSGYGGTYTDGSGQYQLKGLKPGTYKVWFYPYERNYFGIENGFPADTNYRVQWYNGKDTFLAGDAVATSLGSPATGIDAVLTENGGAITGRITDSLENGIAGASIALYQSEYDTEWYDSDLSDANGNYQIKGLIPGNYKLLVLPPGGTFYRREFYDNILDYENATPVQVNAGQTVMGIDIVLDKGGVITGRVTDSNGTGLPNLFVRLLAPTANKYLGWLGNNARTDWNGNYTLNALAGQWKVMFQTGDPLVNTYLSEYYDDQSAVENAAIITVDPEQTVTGIDAVLTSGGGKISGYVKDPGNTGLYNAEVDVYDTQYNSFIGFAFSDVNGYFELSGLIPGNYKIFAVYKNIYPQEWYSDQTTYETAKILAVTPGGNTFIEVVLGGNDPITPGQILITSPNGGETLTGGSIHQVTWDAVGCDPGQPVIIEYSLDNGGNWLMINPETANTGSYSWTVPAVNSGTCRVRITSGDGDAVLSDESDGSFEIVSALPPSIRLLSPKRWMEITAGTVQTITWTWTGNVNQVVIEYSTDSGITWSTIAASASNTGSYQWAVPDTPSQHCHLRIFLGDGDSESAPFDITDTEFAVTTTTTPSLTITSPNGGEAWKVGTAQTITWVKTGDVPNVKIEYTINNGTSWLVIIASTTNTGSYPWTVPNSPSGQCKVRVSDIDGNPTDMSNAVFTIEPLPVITLTSPNGGETWEAGTVQDITWTWTGTGGDVKIEYSADGGTTWSVVTPSADGGGIYSWTVPDTPSGNCLVRIGRDDTEEGPTDISDGVFTIEAAQLLALQAPNGGEQWKAGETYRISWTASNLEGNVVIDLYRGDDFDFNIGTESVNNGRLEWKIPGNFKNANDYRVVIHKDQTEDASDTAFSITERKPNNPDFDNDGKVDILWLNPATGKNEVWYMDGCRRKSVGILPPGPGLDFQLVGTADFNRDGKVDILWRHSKNGQNLVWYMDGIRQQGADVLPVQPDINWQIVGTGDFNGDGKTDILWKHVLKGLGQVWFMDGVTVTGNMAVPPREDPDWQAVATGDFNDDEKVDILWRNVKDGRNEVWFMDGVVRTRTMAVQEQPRLQWQFVGTGDFNGDGHIDILWRRSSDGKHLVWYMDGVVRIGYEYINISPDTRGSSTSDLN